jgi:hypothetical protein
MKDDLSGAKVTDNQTFGEVVSFALTQVGEEGH